MSNVTYVTDVELYTFNCGHCGGTYALSNRFRESCYRDGTGWHCPYCQRSWGYYTNNRHKELEDALKREQQRAASLEASRKWERERREAAEHSNRALKGVVTKKRKQLDRVKNGVCPCCNRHFANLERHIATKHPQFQEA